MEKFKNLLKFNLIFSRFTNGATTEDILLNSSPDYIIEKFKQFLGIDPMYKEIELNVNDEDFLIEYNKIWNNIEHKNILVYLLNTDGLNIKILYNNFEKYIGDFDMITSKTTKGLHKKIEKTLLASIISNNKKQIEIISRDLKINNILKDKIE